MNDVLHDHLPLDAVAHPLPGTRPLAPGDWLRRDERYNEQMALRDKLIIAQRDEVLAHRPEGAAPARELLSLVLAELGVSGGEFHRSDGKTILIDTADPLATLGRLCQEDFAIMVPGAGEHWLAAGIICFPSRWRLSEKIGHPLIRIHRPVDVYDDGMARRVQRLFDGVKVDRPIVRWNRLPYLTSDLFNPQSETDPETPCEAEGARPFLRMERQVIKRMPETQAVVFSIHTWLVKS